MFAVRTSSALAAAFATLVVGGPFVGQLVTPACAADQGAPGPEARARAASLYDQGVAAFAKAEYGIAARAFLEADGIAPSPQAITNAIAAARKANDHLLVAQAAERAIARGDAVTAAREALVEAATKLARLEVSCELRGCSAALDGEPIPLGTTWALPGTHRMTATGATAELVAEETLVCVAGATYRVSLRATPPPRAPAAAPAPAVIVTPAPASAAGLPREWLYAGIGLTVALAAVTTWSGLDTLGARDALSPEPSQDALDDVLARAHRTDALLVGTGVAALGAVLLGVYTGDDDAPARPAVAPVAGGLTALVTGTF